ncbi:MAG: aminopeptidase P family protein [Rhodospirillales bacterium]|nr:aminopeptidase P family protein [Rhodospirillales bacterium]
MENPNESTHLEDLLRQSGSDADVNALTSIIKGVAAAPAASAADEWMALVSDNPSDALQAELRTALADARKADGGLDGEVTQPARITALRAEMARAGVDGFIIPRCDAHQGEYVSLNAERLAWLTGFTGSAGMAVVLTDKAAIFVDGRYTLQARDQIDVSLFDICHMSELPATTWITDSVSKGSRIAYDPWLLTPLQVERYRKACVKAGASLVAATYNLVDRVWTDRPQDPVSPINPQTDTFSGRNSAEKRLEIGNELAEQGVDAVFLSAPDSIAWLLNIRGGDVPYTPFALSFALLNADGTAEWFVDQRKLTKSVKNHLGNGVTVRNPDDLGPALRALAANGATVLLSPSEHPAWVFQQFDDRDGQVVRGSDPCQLKKAVKNATEISGIRNAHVRDGVAVCRFLAWVDNNAASGATSELAASDQLEAYRRENQLFRGLSFPTIAGSGPNGAIVHYRVTKKSNRQLDQNSLFLVDSGAQYLDGTTDITRTMAIGTASAEMRRNFTLVLKGHIALAQARFPVGTTGSQLDVLARQHLWQAGLDYDHGTGHGVGAHLSVHEGPQRISKMANSTALQPGMVISNEPGYYQEGGYGIRIENLVCVRALDPVSGGERPMLGFDTLTFAPIDKRLVLNELLTAPERQWLNTYHQSVFDKIAGQLPEPDRIWLEQATAPI